jgi:hypothetical protein
MILIPNHVEKTNRIRLHLSENAQQYSKPYRLSSEFRQFKILLVFIVCIVILKEFLEWLLCFIEYL